MAKVLDQHPPSRRHAQSWNRYAPGTSHSKCIIEQCRSCRGPYQPYRAETQRHNASNTKKRMPRPRLFRCRGIPFPLLRLVWRIAFLTERGLADAGKAAVRRGPVVYCLESVDNPGILLHSARIQAHPEFTLKAADGLPEGTDALLFRGEAVKPSDGPLYGTNPPAYEAVELCAIPFALWQNRGKSSMQIFLQVKE